MRKSGILLPVSSLPSKYGIGCFSKSAYSFVDFLERAGQSLWQVLPLVPTAYGDSPYASPSSFAGNPYFISPDRLVEEGRIDEALLRKLDFGENTNEVDYGKLYENRHILLKSAYDKEKGYIFDTDDYIKFYEDNSFWLDDYAVFDTLKKEYKVAFTQFPKPLMDHDEKEIKKYIEDNKDEINFRYYVQYIFYKNWSELKEYANKKGIQIIGDVPIYVAFDSSDLWGNRELFEIKDGLPSLVAGCPPDGFSPTGQLWGNPLYNWENHEKDNYDWWVKRFKHASKLYDIVRLDHFRGYDQYWAIPFGDKDARGGSWMNGPGIKLFNRVKEEVPNLNAIAEDLGFLTPTVRKLLKDSGFPGMKVLEFAFDDTEDSDYLPYKYSLNSVVYTGTHDNDTVIGWYKSLNAHDKDFANRYMNRPSGIDNICRDMIKLAMSSVADTCIIPMQDYLELDTWARLNEPNTMGKNWKWRMKRKDISDYLADEILEITKLYGRVIKK